MVTKIRLGGGRITGFMPVTRTSTSQSTKKATKTPIWPAIRAIRSVSMSRNRLGAFLRPQLAPDILDEEREFRTPAKVFLARVSERYLDDLGNASGMRRHHHHPFRQQHRLDRKSTRLNSSHMSISYAVFCLKKKNTRIS